MNIFTKFHKDWATIVDFLLIAKFWASLLFFVSPSITRNTKNHSIVEIEGVPKLFGLAKNLAINKKSTIVVQSL